MFIWKAWLILFFAFLNQILTFCFGQSDPEKDTELGRVVPIVINITPSATIGVRINHMFLEQSPAFFVANAWIYVKWNKRPAESKIPELTWTSNKDYLETNHLHLLSFPHASSDGSYMAYGQLNTQGFCATKRMKILREEYVCVFKLALKEPNVKWDLNITDITKDEENFPFYGDFVPNRQWKILSESAFKTLEQDGNSKPFPVASFYYHINRPLKFFHLCILVPIAVASFINMSIFLLPPCAKEKLTLSSITFFQITAYSTYLASQHTVRGNGMGNITVYIFCNFILAFLCIVVSVIVLNFSTAKILIRPPSRISRVFSFSLARKIGLGYMLPQKLPKEALSLSELAITGESNIFRASTDQVSEVTESVSKLEIRAEKFYTDWYIVAAVIDRISFFVYLILWLIITILFGFL